MAKAIKIHASRMAKETVAFLKENTVLQFKDAFRFYIPKLIRLNYSHLPKKDVVRLDLILDHFLRQKGITEMTVLTEK